VIVLSDTSPINYLVLIGHVEVLPTLFGEVVLPVAVRDELLHPGAPQLVRDWIVNPPDWLVIRQATQIDTAIQLGAGEVEAISLAVELGADLILMDDRLARRAAEARGIPFAGTLNVLEAAAERNLLDLPSAVAKLRQTNFHISEKILAAALENDAARRSQRGPLS
jgi:predicted nucleic acid-binding protein